MDNEFRYEIEYNTRTDKAYGLQDMTVRSYLELAHKLVDARKPGHKKKKGKKGGKGKKGKKGNKGKGKKDAARDKEGNAWEDEVDSDGDLDEDDDEEVEDLVRKGREHKGHIHRKGNRERDIVFREFLNRAFVQTLSASDLDSILGIESQMIDPIDDGDSDDYRNPRSDSVTVSSMGTGRSRPLEFMQGLCREGEMTVEDQLEILHGLEKDVRLAWKEIEDSEAL